ncbi:hypothetical protein FACS189461_3910 [Spirochaetia bacterium]|nr:hypothetical protein FACS189461_3910 [Spirochaetia bacterium]
MGTKVRVKPVQPTEIRDKAVIEQVIKEVRRRPSRAQIARMEWIDAKIMGMIKK